MPDVLRTPLARGLGSLAALLLLASAAHAAASFDLVLAGGRVIDPESGLDAVRSVGIREGRVEAVSETPLEAERRVDVSDFVVAPGFIDLHVHGQEPESYDWMARDGVTTALELEAGVHDLPGFLARREGRARVHFGASAGHIPARAFAVDGIRLQHVLTAETMEKGPRLWWTALRFRVFGSPTFGHAPGDIDTRARLLAALASELDAGAIGVGMGLAYTPGAPDEEIRAVFALAARRDVPLFLHLPGQEQPRDVAPIEFALAHARATGAALHIVHVNSSSKEVLAEFLARIEAARAEGLDVTVEAYPYAASSTLLESALFDPGWRERLGADFGDLQWAATGERLTAESFERYRAEGGAVVMHVMDPEQVAAAIAHPLVMVASDGMPMQGARPHPRGAGTHARVLGRHVRERGELTLSQALEKLSLAPARRLEAVVPAMRRKGRIAVGADADLVVFDPDRIADRASFEDPYQASTGIAHVLVAGEFVLRDGMLVENAAPGVALRASKVEGAPR
jgi:dihydroorotase